LGNKETLVGSKEIRTVTSYKFLGALITSDGYIHDEIKRRITLGKAAMAKLTKITTQEFRPTQKLSECRQ
jgi:hypothetical protein